MISFSFVDVLIILSFFSILLFIGFYSGRKTKTDASDYLLSNRSIGLFLFIAINVSTWYGGILGVGEFSYRYGLVSWFTQGFPYYIFAFLFAIFFAKKIREASLFTIPDKLSQMYGKNVGLISAIIVFILVSPAPYLLMTGSLFSLIFKIDLLPSLLISMILSLVYLVRGGFRSNVYVDVFQFFVMFGGFILVVVYSGMKFGTIDFLSSSLPENHLKITGGMSSTFLIVWFLIALWTFADPGFHQRCYAAKTGNIAKWGIIISIFFFALFDFLTTTTGLFAKAILPNLENPVLSFPLFAEKVLPDGIKGIFYAALFATIISTQVSFLFLSGTTIGRDFIYRGVVPLLRTKPDESKLKTYTVVGLIISGIIAILLAYFIPSVIQIWYTIGSLFIPGIIFPVVSAYYSILRIDKKIILLEMITAIVVSTGWYFLRNEFSSIPVINEVEPMLVGLAFALGIHVFGIFLKK
ncbi:MAG: sodium:solute symporter family protein [Ignavibacteriota bacterium]|nr:MAG: sodium:solute symporter family protein [Chlorobiota bacterium]MBE7478158.1 sodium:solute symporter family protein [Ignavibacteriales bacterium]MBL1121612.1 sodium:solute symporter family protein [Ignavibacteriota bacterium]MCE7856752.1 sodium:solute symporter family protein [Ignavibacteria bacterium CHB3]MEB2297082.1 sodium:solute symporter family protein [Ignavibacteria bacterium]GJQ42718.1 MAG: sodium:solute symporter [Ignavibacteriaceae bacterium]